MNPSAPNVCVPCDTSSSEKTRAGSRRSPPQLYGTTTPTRVSMTCPSWAMTSVYVPEGTP